MAAEDMQENKSSSESAKESGTNENIQQDLHSEEEEIKKMKTWLFRENIRIQNEQSELESMKEKLIADRTTFRNEMNILNNRMTVEHKRLREETAFLEKKMQILKDGFKKLEIDRQSLEQEYRLLEEKKAHAQQDYFSLPDGNRVVEALFRSVQGNSHGLQKRYRDLLKIFHPDNNDGDAELVQLINEEYNKRKNGK